MSRWNLFCTLPWMGTCQCEAGAAGSKLAPATPCLSSWGCTCYMSSPSCAHFENTTQWKLQHVNAVHRAVEVTGDLQKKSCAVILVLLLAEQSWNMILVCRIINWVRHWSIALKFCVALNEEKINDGEKEYFCPCRSISSSLVFSERKQSQLRIKMFNLQLQLWRDNTMAMWQRWGRNCDRWLSTDVQCAITSSSQSQSWSSRRGWSWPRSASPPPSSCSWCSTSACSSPTTSITRTRTRAAVTRFMAESRRTVKGAYTPYIYLKVIN